MTKRRCNFLRMLGGFCVLLGCCNPILVLAHPSLNAHTHDNSTVMWEADGVKDGTAAHNHLLPSFYNGAETLTGPFSAGACWDNEESRIDAADATFDKGHCFVNQGVLGGTPFYYFDSGFPSSAADRVVDAFEEWNDLNILSTSLAMGLGFGESQSSSGAKIIVSWEDLPAIAHGGEVTFSSSSATVTLKFDSSINWSFSKSKSGVGPNEWHFYSVALHEVGHVVGLAHQTDADDVMNGPVGLPIAQNGRQFQYIDSDSELGAEALYSQPPGQPSLSNACSITLEFGGCPNGNTPTFLATVLDTSGMGGVSMIDIDYQLPGWSTWNDIADAVAGCYGYSGTKNKWNKFRAKIFTSGGIGECTTQIFIPSDQCDEEAW